LLHLSAKNAGPGKLEVNEFVRYEVISRSGPGSPVRTAFDREFLKSSTQGPQTRAPQTEIWLLARVSEDDNAEFKPAILHLDEDTPQLVVTYNPRRRKRSSVVLGGSWTMTTLRFHRSTNGQPNRAGRKPRSLVVSALRIRNGGARGWVHRNSNPAWH